MSSVRATASTPVLFTASWKERSARSALNSQILRELFPPRAKEARKLFAIAKRSPAFSASNPSASKFCWRIEQLLFGRFQKQVIGKINLKFCVRRGNDSVVLIVHIIDDVIVARLQASQLHFS